LAVDTASITCSACGATVAVPDDVSQTGNVTRCLVCRSQDLFVRKDFPQRLGVTIVVLGFIASSVAWYYYRILLTFGILFATAAIDVLLYAVVGEALVCYRCKAHYRGVANLSDHAAFDLETHERYRQMAARQPQRGIAESDAAHGAVHGVDVQKEA
jgi:hypothetical protein